MDTTDAVDAAIGERVHLWMWRTRVSQMDLAERLEMTQSSLSRKLRGISPWSASEVLRVAQVLEVSVAWVYGEPDAVRPKGLEPLTFWSGVCRTADLALTA